MPISPYAVAKLSAESYCRTFFRVYGLQTVSLRYFNVFGPRQDPLSQYAAVVPNFITALLNGRPLTVSGDGQQSRDFTYVDNVVEANDLAMFAADVAGRTFNVACGEQVSVSRLIEELEDLTGAHARVEYATARAGDVRQSWASLERAQLELGYSPTVDLVEGLRRTIDYFAELRDSSRSGVRGR